MHCTRAAVCALLFTTNRTNTLNVNLTSSRSPGAQHRDLEELIVQHVLVAVWWHVRANTTQENSHCGLCQVKYCVLDMNSLRRVTAIALPPFLATSIVIRRAHPWMARSSPSTGQGGKNNRDLAVILQSVPLHATLILTIRPFARRRWRSIAAPLGCRRVARCLGMIAVATSLGRQ